MEDITKQNKSVIPNPDVHPFSILARISFHSHMFLGDLKKEKQIYSESLREIKNF